MEDSNTIRAETEGELAKGKSSYRRGAELGPWDCDPGLCDSQSLSLLS